MGETEERREREREGERWRDELFICTLPLSSSSSADRGNSTKLHRWNSIKEFNWHH